MIDVGIWCGIGFFVRDTLRPYTGPAVNGYGGSSNRAQQVFIAILPCRTNSKLIYLLLPNTLYDPNSGCNLVSHSQLRANGTKVHFADDSFVLTTASGPIYAKESYGLYWFQLEDAAFTRSHASSAFPAYAIKDEWLAPWHARWVI
ncbi:hypothetical protein E4U60_003337 [Claviceps pazoutovae]|uniref:Uncharacterized protein n=1 Tax=Claviceps pazoutovae TaxID=1649127 RepID=A0A9P7MIB7_9HYPO|nr:hypothetical protein E4U60_003337 [Claviceps pazoutovae]